jgi:hypothetical protein
MTDTATQETGPVDAPASIESIVAELESGGEQPASNLEEVTQELVKDTEEAANPKRNPVLRLRPTPLKRKRQKLPRKAPRKSRNLPSR